MNRMKFYHHFDYWCHFIGFSILLIIRHFTSQTHFDIFIIYHHLTFDFISLFHCHIIHFSSFLHFITPLIIFLIEFIGLQNTSFPADRFSRGHWYHRHHFTKYFILAVSIILIIFVTTLYWLLIYAIAHYWYCLVADYGLQTSLSLAICHWVRCKISGHWQFVYFYFHHCHCISLSLPLLISPASGHLHDTTRWCYFADYGFISADYWRIFHWPRENIDLHKPHWLITAIISLITIEYWLSSYHAKIRYLLITSIMHFWLPLLITDVTSNFLINTKHCWHFTKKMWWKYHHFFYYHFCSLPFLFIFMPHCRLHYFICWRHFINISFISSFADITRHWHY